MMIIVQQMVDMTENVHEEEERTDQAVPEEVSEHFKPTTPPSKRIFGFQLHTPQLKIKRTSLLLSHRPVKIKSIDQDETSTATLLNGRNRR